MVACSLPLLGTAYQINPSVASTSNTIGVLQPVNTIPIAPAHNKTITLTSGGKTLTLTGGTFQPGTQYVLSKLKGKIPTLVMADKKPAITANQPGDATKGVQSKDQAVASTSYQSPKKVRQSRYFPITFRLRSNIFSERFLSYTFVPACACQDCQISHG